MEIHNGQTWMEHLHITYHEDGRVDCRTEHRHSIAEHCALCTAAERLPRSPVSFAHVGYPRQPSQDRQQC